jgi:hypothetical protein
MVAIGSREAHTQCMTGNQSGVLAATHFEDLQAGMEAGSRQISQIHQTATDIRAALFRKHLKQAHVMGLLVKQIGELRECVRQQRMSMRDLSERYSCDTRHDARAPLILSFKVDRMTLRFSAPRRA